MLLLTLLVLNVPVWLFLPTLALPIVLSALSLVTYMFVFNFFRCPQRHYHGDKLHSVCSSVDGKVVVIEKTFEPEFIKGEAIQVSVFMSPLNVHANWFPVQGEVVYVRHHEGRFLSAWLPKASTENERSTIGIITAGGRKVTVRQIAGAMARRIVTYAQEGEQAEIDEHLGFIKFGSRVDIYLPTDSQVLVNLGDRVSGDITEIAKLPRG